MSFRFQKFLAAKTAATKSGRELMKGMLGDHGEKLFETVIDFVEKYSKDKEKARKTEKYLFKIISKTIVLVQGGKISASSFTPLVESSKAFCWQVVDQCELSMVLFNPVPLVAHVNKVCDLMHDLLKDHITGKTLERIAKLKEFFGSEETFTALLKHDEFREHKGEISHSLIKLLKEMEIARQEEEDEKKADGKAEKK